MGSMSEDPSDAASTSSDEELQLLQTQARDASAALAAWLEGHALQRWAGVLTAAEVDLALLPTLTDCELQQLGVTTLGGRRRLQRAAAQLLREEHAIPQSEDPEDCWKQVPAKISEREQSEGPEACWKQVAAGRCERDQSEGPEACCEPEAHQHTRHSAEQQMNDADSCWAHGLHQCTGQPAEPGSSPAMQPHSPPDAPGRPCDSVEQLTQLYDAEQPNWDGQPGACSGDIEMMAMEAIDGQEPQLEALLWAAEHSLAASEEAEGPSVDGGGRHLEATRQWQRQAAAPDGGPGAPAARDWQLCSGTGHAEAAIDSAIGDDEVVSLLTQEGHSGPADRDFSPLADATNRPQPARNALATLMRNASAQAAAQAAAARHTAAVAAAAVPKDAFAALMQSSKRVAQQPAGGSFNGAGGRAKKARWGGSLSGASTALAAQLQPQRVLPAQGQVPQRLKPTEGQPSRRGSGSRSAWLPEWQRVPGTSFVVDKFRSVQKVVCRHWFLSHFHADHYGGLSGRFCQGTLYCNEVTARLVRQQLRVAPERICTVPMCQPITVEGVRITFVDANHCPGAAMILFEPPGAPPVVHTGDCRCHTGMQEEAVLQAVRGRAILVLDTTYCQPQYVFPAQQEVLRFVLDAVRAEGFNNKRTLFLFGSYTIGKEKIFLEVARALKHKVYVSLAKKKVLQCTDLDAGTLSLLTTFDGDTNLHVVPLWSITQKAMADTLRRLKGRFNMVVGFRPTGWSLGRGAGGASGPQKGCGSRKQRGSIITYEVPYSEHSSFPELKAFTHWLRPVRIIPSVGNDRGPKAEQMVRLLQT